MEMPVYFIDTFTSTSSRGNPAAVCCPDREIKAEIMQSVATELNLPVTAFIREKTGQPGTYHIQYFTPVTEIPACGHATLAAARAVQELKGHATLHFVTVEEISITASCNKGNIMMRFPRYAWKETTVDRQILDSLGLATYRAAAFAEELETLFIETENATILRNLQPNFPELVKASNTIIEVVVTCESDNNNYDYLLRSFCPWIGIDEDPVTGSVHSVLAGYWKERFNKSELKAYQASARGGELLIQYFNDSTGIGGQTVLVKCLNRKI